MRCQNISHNTSTLNSSVWLGESYPSPSSGKTHKSLNTAPGPESSWVLFLHSLKNTYLQHRTVTYGKCWAVTAARCLGEETRQTLQPETTMKLCRCRSMQILHASAVKQPEPHYPAVPSTASTWLAALPNSPANPLIKAEEQPLLTAPHALMEGVVLH